MQLSSFSPKIFVCVLLFSQADLAGGEGTGDPQQVESLEGDQHKANVGRQVFGTLWVHEVVCGSAAGILFIPTVGARFILEHTDPIKLDRENTPSLSLKQTLLLWHFIIFRMTE